jgi:hypothetical protein
LLLIRLDQYTDAFPEAARSIVKQLKMRNTAVAESEGGELEEEAVQFKLLRGDNAFSAGLVSDSSKIKLMLFRSK